MNSDICINFQAKGLKKIKKKTKKLMKNLEKVEKLVKYIQDSDIEYLKNLSDSEAIKQFDIKAVAPQAHITFSGSIKKMDSVDVDTVAEKLKEKITDELMPENKASGFGQHINRRFNKVD